MGLRYKRFHASYCLVLHFTLRYTSLFQFRIYSKFDSIYSPNTLTIITRRLCSNRDSTFPWNHICCVPQLEKGRTCYVFSALLYKALSDKGIHTFIDDDKLQSGEEKGDPDYELALNSVVTYEKDKVLPVSFHSQVSSNPHFPLLFSLSLATLFA